MTLFLTIFALIQAAGAVIGAGGSVFAEIFYLKAIQDGHIDNAEREHLRAIGQGLRWGMLLLLVGSIGLTLTNFVYVVPIQPALTHAYWIEMGLAFAIILFTYLNSNHVVSFTVGSAGIFTGWWYLALLVFGRLPAMSFGAAVALYVVSTAILAALLMYARMIARRHIV